MICLPPHSTHIMQPLDVGCFGILAKAYRKHLRNWVYQHPHGETYTREAFWEVLSASRKDTYTTHNVLSAWRESGCWLIEKFQPAPATVKKQQEVETSQPSQTPRLAYRAIRSVADSPATSYKLRAMADQLHKTITAKVDFTTDNTDIELLKVFTKLSQEKLTQYRDIQPQANTLRTPRTGKKVHTIPDLRYIAKGRLLTRKEVKKGIAKLIERKLKEDKAETKRQAKGTGKKPAPKRSRAKKLPLKPDSPKTTNMPNTDDLDKNPFNDLSILSN